MTPVSQLTLDQALDEIHRMIVDQSTDYDRMLALAQRVRVLTVIEGELKGVDIVRVLS